MIAIFSGLPGSGKSLKLASTSIDILYRNKRWFLSQYKEWQKKVLKQPLLPRPVPRFVWSNLKMSEDVEKEFKGLIRYWSDLREISQLKDVDVIIDEVATYFDARLWDTLSLEMRRWLAQHRKFGVEIYGTTQDFAQVDKAFRRLTSNLLYLRKLFGSRDISPTKPPPRFIYGLVLVQELDPVVYDEMLSKFTPVGILPKLMLITRSATKVFDTRAEVVLSKALPLKHIERVCELSNCTFHKTQHI